MWYVFFWRDYLLLVVVEELLMIFFYFFNELLYFRVIFGVGGIMGYGLWLIFLSYYERFFLVKLEICIYLLWF